MFSMKGLLFGLTSTLALSPAICAVSLTLRQAEKAAVNSAHNVRIQQMAEKARAWELRNAYAGYLPSISYAGIYSQMDRKTVNRANSLFDLMEDPEMSPIKWIALNSWRIDSLSRYLKNPGYTPPPFNFMNLVGSNIIENPQPVFHHSFSHAISVHQPLSNGGAELVAIRLANRARKVVRYQLQAARQQAVYDARQAYFKAMQAREVLLLSQKSLDFAARNLKKAKFRHQGGTVPVTDVLQWEAEELLHRNQLDRARAAFRVSRLSLIQVIGEEVAQADSVLILANIKTLEDWYAKGEVKGFGNMEGNPNLQAVKAATQMAGDMEKMALTRFLPKLNAFLNYYWPAYKRPVPWQDRRGWTAGARLDVPIWSGFRNSTQWKKNQYGYKKALVEEHRAENQFRLNLERIDLFYKSAYSAVAGARKQRELMDKQLELMQQRYDGGLANQAQLLEVSLGADRARLGYLDKLFECLLLESEGFMNTGKLEIDQ